MDKNISLSTFLKNGLYKGATAGFVISLGFIFLLTIIFGIIIGSFDIFITVFILAISFGFFPATIIACLFGLVSGFIYYLFQNQITTTNRSRILSLLLSLGLAASVITFWSSFFLNGLKVEGMRFTWDMYLFFTPFCAAGGLYVGKKLHEITQYPDKFVPKDSLIDPNG